MTATLNSRRRLVGLVRRSAQRDRTGIAVRAVDLLSTWFERSRQRRHLHSLDEHMLKDIGVTRADVEFEAQKHFWMR